MRSEWQFVILLIIVGRCIIKNLESLGVLLYEVCVRGRAPEHAALVDDDLLTAPRPCLMSLPVNPRTCIVLILHCLSLNLLFILMFY